MGQRPLLTVWLTLTAALIVVATLVSVDVSTGLELTQAEAEPIDPGSPVAIATASGNANSVVYGSLEWTLVASRLIPRNDDAFSRPVVILEMVARNLDGQHPARARSRDMVLILDDGTRAPTVRFEHTPSTYRLTVEPGETLPVTLVFKPPVPRNPWLDDVRLEIAAEGRRPASLRLDGKATASHYPISSTVAGGLVRLEDSEVGLTLTSARIDINAGPYRATVDEQLVVLELIVTPESAAAEAADHNDAAWQSRDFWQLELLGPGPTDVVEPIVPNHVSPLPMRGGDIGSTSRTLELVFAVPADIELPSMVLGAGPERAKIGSIRPTSVAN